MILYLLVIFLDRFNTTKAHLWDGEQIFEMTVSDRDVAQQIHKTSEIGSVRSFSILFKFIELKKKKSNQWLSVQLSNGKIKITPQLQNFNQLVPIESNQSKQSNINKSEQTNQNKSKKMRFIPIAAELKRKKKEKKDEEEKKEKKKKTKELKILSFEEYRKQFEERTQQLKEKHEILKLYLSKPQLSNQIINPTTEKVEISPSNSSKVEMSPSTSTSPKIETPKQIIPPKKILTPQQIQQRKQKKKEKQKKQQNNKNLKRAKKNKRKKRWLKNKYINLILTNGE